MDVTIRLACAFACACLIMTAAPALAQSGAAPPERSTAAGAYTTQQAAEGEALFRNVCGNCHTASQFSGPAFQKTWVGRAVYSLFDQLRNTMPIDNPGGLSRREYASVIAYILKLNAFPAGKTELPTEDAALKQIRFDTVAATRD